MRKKIVKWLLGKIIIPRFVKELEETSKLYAISYWEKTYPDELYIKKGVLDERLLDIQDSFMDGYIKALHDNDLKFEGGKIVKNIEKYT